MVKIRSETLEHSTYSPDVSPCDYHIFGPLKEELGVHHFDDDESEEIFVRNWLKTRPASLFYYRIKKLLLGWKKMCEFSFIFDSPRCLLY